MTDADVPSLALKDLIPDPVNPFTGKEISAGKEKEPQYITTFWAHQTGRRKGTVFEAAQWYRVTPGEGSVLDPARWEFLPEWE